MEYKKGRENKNEQIFLKNKKIKKNDGDEKWIKLYYHEFKF